MPYICNMNYIIDIQKSKAIRKMLKHKTFTIPLNVHTYFGQFNQDVTMRFVNCENVSWGCSSIAIEVTINGTFESVMGLNDFPKGHRITKKRKSYIVKSLRNSIQHNKLAKSLFKSYLAHFGLTNIHIDTIKFKHNETKS